MLPRTLSLHDALPILERFEQARRVTADPSLRALSATALERLGCASLSQGTGASRSEEHTSELQSRENLVCRLLLEKKRNQSREDSDLSRYPSIHRIQ